jgi:alanine racemase
VDPGPLNCGLVRAEVDLDAVAANTRNIARVVRPARLFAVVKADGYGLGAVPVARVALASGASGLCVARPEEGLALRAAGIKAPILILGPTVPALADQVVRAGLTPTVCEPGAAAALARAAEAQSRPLPVHVKIDTGLHRYGILPSEAPAFLNHLAQYSRLRVEGLWTHLATADEADRTFAYEQLARFNEVTAALPAVPLRHAASTAAALDLPEFRLDLVRAGIGIYGYYPSRHVGRAVALRPALTLKSRVIRVHQVGPGETVGYGRTWVAPRSSRIALVACGYGDGYPRHLSNRGVVLIRGRRCPVVGRVSMDLLTADATHLPEVAVGDEVVLVGRQGEEEITLDELAELAETVPYELLTRLTPRVPRVYVGSQSVLEAGLAEGVEKDLR